MYFSKKWPSSSLLNCSSYLDMLWDGHRLTRWDSHGSLLSFAVSCLWQLLTSSVPRALLDGIQIPREELCKRWQSILELF